MAKNDGGPAFPVAGSFNANQSFMPQSGMSLRDYFSAQALPTVLGLIGVPDREEGPDDLWDAEIAKRCFAIADAMIAERKK